MVENQRHLKASSSVEGERERKREREAYIYICVCVKESWAWAWALLWHLFWLFAPSGGSKNQRGGWDAALSFAGDKSHRAAELTGSFHHSDQGSVPFGLISDRVHHLLDIITGWIQYFPFLWLNRVQGQLPVGLDSGPFTCVCVYIHRYIYIDR